MSYRDEIMKCGQNVGLISKMFNRINSDFEAMHSFINICLLNTQMQIFNMYCVKLKSEQLSSVKSAVMVSWLHHGWATTLPRHLIHIKFYYF